MSKISLSPNVSGTGTLTIAAPNTNNDITLNLPTTMGTNNSSSVVTTNAAGNLGLGVAPSAWSGGKAIEVGFVGRGFWGLNQSSGYSTTNAYFNSGWKYGGTGTALAYGQDAGSHLWFTAPSGTAGAAISFVQAMTLDASSNLRVEGIVSAKVLNVEGAPTGSFSANRWFTQREEAGMTRTYYCGTDTTTYGNWTIYRATSSGSALLAMAINANSDFTIGGAVAIKASGTTWANPSDQRLKDNIRDYTKGSSELMQIRVREWEYNGKGGTTEGMKGMGVIADEAMLVLPGTVDTYDAKLNSDDEETTAIKKFDATEITWLLVKTVQELKAIVDGQAILISAQGAQIAMQSSEIATLTAAVAASKGTA